MTISVSSSSYVFLPNKFALTFSYCNIIDHDILMYTYMEILVKDFFSPKYSV